MFRRFTSVHVLVCATLLCAALPAFAAAERAQQVDSSVPWRVTCDRDPIYDHKTCDIRRGPLYVIMIRHPKGNISTMVSIIYGKDSFPGRIHALRVDSLPPHTATTDAHWNDADSRRIISQLEKGQTARTRFIAWPYGDSIDETIALDGFSESWQALQQAVRQP